ncbi:MAG: hypothetical protein WAO33_01990 [Candidatus Nanopelagicales bacterium]
MKRLLTNGLGIALIAGLNLSLGACSVGVDTDSQANDLAIRACTSQTIAPREGFNPQTASVSELTQLADIALRKSEWADQAAALSPRWSLLSEVSAAIAVFAQQLLEVGENGSEGVREEGAISLDMWDEYKSASDTYLTECKSALKNVSGPLPELDESVTALR